MVLTPYLFMIIIGCINDRNMMKSHLTARNRQRIINGASKLITKRGVINTSLNDISRRLKISPGTLYYYFPTKDELIFEISNQHLVLIGERVLRVVEQASHTRDPYQILEAVLTIFTMSSEKIGEAHLYLLQAAILQKGTLSKKFLHAYRQWIEKIEQGVHEVLGERKSKAHLSRMIIALIDGILIQNLIGMEQPDYHKLVRLLKVR